MEFIKFLNFLIKLTSNLLKATKRFKTYYDQIRLNIKKDTKIGRNKLTYRKIS